MHVIGLCLQNLISGHLNLMLKPDHGDLPERCSFSLHRSLPSPFHAHSVALANGGAPEVSEQGRQEMRDEREMDQEEDVCFAFIASGTVCV